MLPSSAQTSFFSRQGRPRPARPKVASGGLKGYTGSKLFEMPCGTKDFSLFERKPRQGAALAQSGTSGSGSGGGPGAKTETGKKADDQKKGFFDSGFLHGLKTGDGSGPENKPEEFRKDSRDDIHRLAEANGTASPRSDPSADPEERAERQAIGRQAEIGRNIAGVAVIAAVQVEGSFDTKHKITSTSERWGVKVHDFIFGKAKDKAEATAVKILIP